MSREKVKEIVDYMVSEGTQNTNSWKRPSQSMLP